MGIGGYLTFLLVCISVELFAGLCLMLMLGEGTITNMSVLGGRQPEFTEEELASSDHWRRYPTKPIKEFFKELQDKMSGANLGKNRNYVRC